MKNCIKKCSHHKLLFKNYDRERDLVFSASKLRSLFEKVRDSQTMHKDIAELDTALERSRS